ncbi:MAG TPA: hypothetical protein VM580_22935 [Labilithrix sp.]|nr:hypothetical protein [Labilithrix sp.]
MRAYRSFFAGVVVATLLACGSSSSRTGFNSDPKESADPTEGTDAGAGTTPPGSFGEADPAPVAVTLRGTVYTPNGELPLSNALVYVTRDQPAEIPKGAYCDACVALPKGSFTSSEADGTFELKAELSPGKVFLVTQKGQLRRVREIEISKAGVIAIDEELTTLPGKSNPSAGDTSPRMLVVKDSTDFDKIDKSIDKLGLEDVTVRTNRSVLENADELLKYHIVFIPCGSSSDSRVTSSTVQENLRNFVRAGGKLYVTDWSYEFVRQPFPGFLSWVGETSTIGSATGSEWDAPATAVDEGLAAWLAASGDDQFTVEGNWTKINGIYTSPGVGPKGEPADITPKIWVTGDYQGTTYPTTVSFAEQCGQVLFSTYHTEDKFSQGELHAQEKALLYVLLDVGVCAGEGGTVH